MSAPDAPAVPDPPVHGAGEARPPFATVLAMFDHAATGVILHDGDGRILEANPAFQQLVGYSLDELRAKLIGLVNAPATKIAQVVNAPAAKLARVFGAYAAKEAA